ncbi:MAG: Coenzyme F420 hydrogenase/dehydrogenase, beta subunit C-terminal domain, partial [Candidatus Bathyarchaeia archaeon]
MSKPPKIFGSLTAEVIRTGLCMYCGTCIASCPVNVLHYTEDEKPTIKGICVLCELCYYSCPRVELPLNEYEEKVFGRSRRPDEPLGIVEKAYLARSRDEEILKAAQDGGVASTILIYALERGLIDVAAVTASDPENPLKPIPILASKREEILSAAGSKYSPSGSVGLLGDAELGYPNAKVGFVGLPCQIQGIRRLTFSPKGNRKRGEQVSLAIGLFCMDSFHYKGLADHLKSQLNLTPTQIGKLDIKKGKLKVYRKEGQLESLETPVKDLNPYLIQGCSRCQDFTGELADISLGAVDAPNGWCVVLTRSKLGDAIIAEMCEKDLLEC